MDHKVDKGALRVEMKRLRASMPLASRAAENAMLCKRLIDIATQSQASTIAAFWPLPHEIDLRDALGALHHAGHRIALPVLAGKEQPLIFRQWTPDLALLSAAFGTKEPPPSSPLLIPTLMIVPLLAFDRDGGRLGYGGGFYDRTLASLRADGHTLQAYGVAFSCQECPSVPTEDTDEPLDAILTASEVITLS